MVLFPSRLFGLALACLVATAGAAADPALAWHTDYDTAMKESEKKKLPILVVVGSDACSHCLRMDAETFRNEKVVAALLGRFVTCKIDATKEPKLVQALGVQVYPTCVLAGPDGKVHGYLQGFQPADDFREHLTKTRNAIAGK